MRGFVEKESVADTFRFLRSKHEPWNLHMNTFSMIWVSCKSSRYALSVVVGHFAVSGVGIWTDRQAQEGGAQRRGAVGVGRVAIFNALKGMPPPLPPCERAHLHVPRTKSRLILLEAQMPPSFTGSLSHTLDAIPVS